MIEKVLHSKIGFSFIMAASTYPIHGFIEKYIFSDWQFAMFLLVIVLIDTALGMYLHFKKGTITSSGFARIFNKLIIYCAVLVLTHLLTRFTVRGEVNPVFQWFDTVMYSAIMVREAISILENAGAISPGLLPKWILKRLEGFDETGNIKSLTDETN